MSLNNIYRVAIVGKLNNQVVINTFHYQHIEGFEVDNELNILELFKVAVLTPLQTFQSQLWTGTKLEVQYVSPGIPRVAIEESIAGEDGLVVGAAAPPAVAAVVRRRTLYAGRRYRGRIYVAGVPVSSITGGQLTALAFADLEDVATGMKAILDDGGFPNNRFSPVLVNATYSRVTQITSAAPDVILRSQRRRQINVGV